MKKLSIILSSIILITSFVLLNLTTYSDIRAKSSNYKKKERNIYRTNMFKNKYYKNRSKTSAKPTKSPAKKLAATISMTPSPIITKSPNVTNTQKTPPSQNQINGVWQNMYFQNFSSNTGKAGQFHLYGGSVTPNTSTGLLVYLHGDGADEFTSGQNSRILNDMAIVGKSHNLLPLALKTPSADITWWKDGEANAAYLNDFFVNYLLKKYTLNKNRVVLVGYSGGSEIITENFLLKYAQNLFLGGAFLFGGGSVQYGIGSGVQYRDSFVKGFKLHYYAGTADYMYEEAKYGADFFAKYGFGVTTDYPQGEDHYNLPIKNVVDNKLNSGFIN